VKWLRNFIVGPSLLQLEYAIYGFKFWTIDNSAPVIQMYGREAEREMINSLMEDICSYSSLSLNQSGRY